MKNMDSEVTKLVGKYKRLQAKIQEKQEKLEEVRLKLFEKIEETGEYETKDFKYTPSREGKPRKILSKEKLCKALGTEDLSEFYTLSKPPVIKPKIVFV